MLIDPVKIDEKKIYNLMMSSILPRPIAWISTVNSMGELNLAPFSYFMGVCCIPMTILFCPVVPLDEKTKKDTLVNIEEIPEFVVNIATLGNIEDVNQTAAPLAYGESEFDLIKCKPVASDSVLPPRVEGASISFECRVRDIIEISDQPGGGWVVLGTVVKVHVADNIINPETYLVDTKKLEPIGRLGGKNFLKSSDTFSIDRPSGS